jgi:hypothetical protein
MPLRSRWSPWATERRGVTPVWVSAVTQQPMRRDVKSARRSVDGTDMTSRPVPGDESERTASMLRTHYRCAMCHKHCPIPCRFTGAEFRLLQQTLVEGASADDIEQLVSTMLRDEGC